MSHALKVGDKLRDNDARMNGRFVEVVWLGLDYVVITSGKRKARVQRRRIHTDGVSRTSGFSLVVSEH